MRLVLFQDFIKKCLLILSIVIIGITSVYADDPNWFVNIKTETSNETITGSGYIVQVGDDYYIRTASHVTLGTDDGIFVSGEGEKLKVKLGQSIIDNSHDDQLIPIEKPKKAKSIAFYSPSIKKFVVWPKLSRIVKREKRKKFVEQGIDAAFYIVPENLQKSKKDIKFDKLEESINTGYSPSFNFSNYLRPTKGKTTLTADMRVNPGESGSPLFKDMLVGYNIQDSNGKHYEYPLPQMSGGATILLGHAQSFQRYVDRSNFSGSKQSENIVNAINDKTLIDTDVKWDRYQGIFYRYKVTEKGLIQELNNIKNRSGNTTGGNGGNTTGGNGGDTTNGSSGNTTGGNGGNTTGGNGGDTTNGSSGNTTGGNGGNTTGGNGGDTTNGSSGNTTGGNGGNTTGGNGGGPRTELDLTGTPKMGMIYHDLQIAGFKVQEFKEGKKVNEYTLYADWENYQYLEDLKKNNSEVKVEPIKLTGKDLANLIQEKNNSGNYMSFSSGSYSRTSRCVVDGESLKHNHLNVNIQPFEPISLPLNENFFPIVEVKNLDDGLVYKVDLRGLFSVDIMEFSDFDREDEFDFYNRNSYVMLRAEGFKYSRSKCKVENGLSFGMRQRLFKGGKLDFETLEQSNMNPSQNKKTTVNPE